MGEARIPGERCAGPVERDAARRSRGKYAGIFAGAGSVAAQLREAALEECSLQPDRDHSVFAAAGSGAVAGDFADVTRADELGAGDQTGNCGGDSVDADAAQQL